MTVLVDLIIKFLHFFTINWYNSFITPCTTYFDEPEVPEELTN